MEETKLYINKERVLPQSEDYLYLRKKGIEYIEKLGSKLWTDYNVHDPGITKLEMLCYAITDLGYRSRYLIQDILAEGMTTDENSKKQFFTAREILTNNPVTINDFRKILIDVEGVKNAWLETSDEAEQSLFIDCEHSRILVGTQTSSCKQLKLHGLYNIILELEEDEELGDLNLYCFERLVESEDENFNIKITLPAWDTYFNLNKKPLEYKFEDIISLPQAQRYKTNLYVTFEDETIKCKVKIKSEGLQTPKKKNIKKEIDRNDKDSLLHHYQQMIDKSLTIAENAYKVLHETRNLCEDFYQFKAIEIEEIIICADIEVASEADLEDTLAKIYYEIDKFLDPPVNFYSIKELMEKGKKSEEVFEGPILNHGFIDDYELESSKFKNEIHVSDLIRIIMDVKGVLAVKDILINSLYNGEPQGEGKKWCLELKEDRATRLNTDKSPIVFYKGLVPYRANETETSKKLKELKMLNRLPKLAKEDYDLPIPKGTNREIQSYYSIQNDFPLCYGIGVEGLPSSAKDRRKAQAKQLKGYLLFFDQMLANFFAQLAHTKDLFRIVKEPELKRTYFSHNLIQKEDYLKEIPNTPNLPNLIKDFVDSPDLTNPLIDLDDYSTYETEWQNFFSNPENDPSTFPREEILESKSTYEDRRNRFLDHLMARYAEQFTDYVLLMYLMKGKKAPAELISDKIAFLKDYPEVSRNRGKAFNYKNPTELWDTSNVTGLEKRVAHLLGISNCTRRSLAECVAAYFKIYPEKDEDDIDEYRFKLVNEEGNILLSSPTRYSNEAEAQEEVRSVTRFGRDEDNYVIKPTENNKYHIVLKDDSDKMIARVIKYFDTTSDAEQAIKNIVKHMQDIECEGFHLIEHILLRPRTIFDKPLNVCVDKNWKNCQGFIDPYSFRVTAVVPYWLKRFRDTGFRDYFESTIRMEAPAHVHVKICWVTREDMKAFEKAYFPWLEEISKTSPDTENLNEKNKKLVKALERLRSVYRETRLYDCKQQDESDIIVLNNSVIGTISED